MDEAHHLLEARREDIGGILPETMPATIYITVHPDAMAHAALRGVEYVLALGPAARDTVATFCKALGEPVPEGMPTPADDEVLFWSRASGRAPFTVKAHKPAHALHRHKRKYAEGELDVDRSFFFRGREGKLNLRAQNLMLFVQLAQGLDADTWQFHRAAGDYSRWFRDVIKDDALADEAAAVEANPRPRCRRQPRGHPGHGRAPLHGIVGSAPKLAREPRPPRRPLKTRAIAVRVPGRGACRA